MAEPRDWAGRGLLTPWPDFVRTCGQDLLDRLVSAGPYVCPGCHAVGSEPCAPDCIDDEIRREVYESLDRDWDEEEDWQ